MDAIWTHRNLLQCASPAGPPLLAAPTLLASWYGMNFHHMPELDQPWAYPAMITTTGAICGVLYWLLKRAAWL